MPGVETPVVVMTPSSSLVSHPGVAGTLPVPFVPKIKFYERPSDTSNTGMQENL